jgi:peptidoglycan-associated lipoprotein
MAYAAARGIRGGMMAIGLVLALAGCSTMEKVASPDVTDAPVGAGVDIPAGSNEDFIVNVGRRIYFTEKSAELNDTARVTLDKQAEFLAQYPQWKIKVEGFADEPGTAEFNMQLSQKRAEVTRAYLISKGVAPIRTRIKAFGNTELVKKCADVTCYSQNRRAVIVLEGRSGA